MLAASGDSGAADVGLDQSTYYTYPVTSWPDSDPLVTGVGGTQLHLDASGQHTAPDNVWNDTYSTATQEFIFGDAGPNPLAGGGGKSIIFGRPWYQNGVAERRRQQPRGPGHLDERGLQRGGGHLPELRRADARLVPDLRHQRGDAAVRGHRGAGRPGGRPPARPDQPRPVRDCPRRTRPGIVDVTTGNNTVSFTQNNHLYTVKGFSAGPGYDLASGVGTVNAAAFVPELAYLGRH